MRDASYVEVRVPESLSGTTIHPFVNELGAALNAGPQSLLLCGTSEVFCRGLNAASEPGQLMDGIRLFGETLCRLRESPVVTIAVVEGQAAGGGVGLAATCDLVIAAETATFGLPESLFGMIPAVIMPALLERMSPSRIRLLAMTGTSCTAEEAQRWGLVDSVAPRDELKETVRSWRHRLCRARPEAVLRLRQWTEQVGGRGWRSAVMEGVQETSATLRLPAVQARLHSFRQDGIPPWQSP